LRPVPRLGVSAESAQVEHHYVIAKDFAGAAEGLSAVPESLTGQAPAMGGFPASRRPLNRCLVPTQIIPGRVHVLTLHFRLMRSRERPV
ncbi:MAG: hypothetical protein VXX24_09015, partial [Pseudomonadota bacterium]|nr:hypothetical protein [Pseudomonadota bacterium]